MNFIEILILIFAIALSIIAIRISFKFDINKFLENRRKIKLNQLKNICPHGTMKLEGDKLIFTSFFQSPVGTLSYICDQCGLIVASQTEANRITKQFLHNPDLFIKRQKKFVKKAKKLKLC